MHFSIYKQIQSYDVLYFTVWGIKIPNTVYLPMHLQGYASFYTGFFIPL